MSNVLFLDDAIVRLYRSGWGAVATTHRPASPIGRNTNSFLGSGFFTLIIGQLNTQGSRDFYILGGFRRLAGLLYMYGPSAVTV